MVRRHSDRQLALEADPDVTNREKIWDVMSRLHAVHIAVDHYEVDCRYGEATQEQDVSTIESALNAERKAGEIEGQIKALEWVRREGDDWRPFTRDTITAALDRLRAEKEKLE